MIDRRFVSAQSIFIVFLQRKLAHTQRINSRTPGRHDSCMNSHDFPQTLMFRSGRTKRTPTKTKRRGRPFPRHVHPTFFLSAPTGQTFLQVLTVWFPQSHKTNEQGQYTRMSSTWHLISLPMIRFCVHNSEASSLLFTYQATFVFS